jgi:hypothetical protein
MVSVPELPEPIVGLAERLLDPRPFEEAERLERLPPVVLDDPIAPAWLDPPAIAISLPESSERVSPAQSLIWSDRRLIWSLISLRLDHRNTPAPTAAAAAAAVVIGRSRTVPIQSLLCWLRPLGLLFRPPR